MSCPENRRKVGQTKIGRKLMIDPITNKRFYIKKDDIEEKLLSGFLFV